MPLHKIIHNINLITNTNTNNNNMKMIIINQTASHKNKFIIEIIQYR